MKGALSIFRDRCLLLARGDQGVALALSLAFLLPLFVLAVCIYAVQETMVRKAILQNAVDSAAYSAAVVEADYFSRAALLNKVIGWCYVQRERARGDFAMAKLAYEADKMLQKDREYCRKENSRACCSKRKIEDEYWGVGTLVDGKTKPYYRSGNNVPNPQQNLQISYIRTIAQQNGAICNNAAPYIVRTGNLMKRCIAQFDTLGREHDEAVKKAAESMLELNLKPLGFDCHAQITTPKWDDVVTPLTCCAEDEKMLFRAAGYQDADSQKVLGPGADLWLARGCDCARTNLLGPSWWGFRELPGATRRISFWKWLIFYGLPVLSPAVWIYMLPSKINEFIQRGRDILAFHTSFRLRANRWKNTCRIANGPCRVLRFDGDKYLSMEWDFFWTRWAKFWWFFNRHKCIEPANVLGLIRWGCHRVGKSRATLYGKHYTSQQFSNPVTAYPGWPVFGEIIGAKGRKLKSEFFSSKGSVRIVAAMNNPNPLRVFAEGSTDTGLHGGKFGWKDKVGDKLAGWLARFDADGIYQVFNSHQSFNQLAAEGHQLSGSQRPDFLFAAAAARAGVRDPRTVTGEATPRYCLQKPPTEVNDYEWNLHSTDWDAFLVPFRGAGYDSGWDSDGATLSPGGILDRAKHKLSFEIAMRNPLNWQKIIGPDGKKGKLMDADTLLRIEDTRGPYPLKQGFSILLWSMAEDYIQH